MAEYNSQLMGANFRPEEAKNIVKALGVDEVVEARRDPENPYDPNAIAIFSQEQHIGFIERGLAEELAPIMDGGASLKVVVVGFVSTLKPYFDIDVVEAA